MDIGHQLDRMKESFLWAAAKGGREEEVESLLSIGADVNWRNGDEGETPLIAACRSGHRGVAALLLAHGGDAMGTSRNGESALHAACRRGPRRDGIKAAPLRAAPRGGSPGVIIEAAAAVHP